MRVAVYYSNDEVRLEERPQPKISQGEVLVRVEKSGICGTDVLEWYRADKTPLVLGHEVAGEVVKVGEGVKDYKAGDRVTAAHHVPCNKCHYCLQGHHTVCETLRQTNFDPGGFAEYVRLPAINVEQGIFPLPEEVSLEEATFVEPVACALRGQRLAGMRPGKSVLIIGSGISGLLHLQVARLQGAGVVVTTDINPYRLEAAHRFGANLSLPVDEDVPTQFRQLNKDLLADLVVATTGAKSALTQALQSVERGGTVLFFAPTEPGLTIPLPVNDLFWRNEITLTSSYGGAPADYAQALKLIQTKKLKLKEMITHRLPLAETGKGFKLVAKAKESLKIIIEPQK